MWTKNCPGLKSKQLRINICHIKVLESYVKIWLSPIVAPPYPSNHDFNKFEFTLLMDASKQIKVYLANSILRISYLNIFYLSLRKNLTFPIVAHPTPMEQDLNILESMRLPKDSSK